MLAYPARLLQRASHAKNTGGNRKTDKQRLHGKTQHVVPHFRNRSFGDASRFLKIPVYRKTRFAEIRAAQKNWENFFTGFQVLARQRKGTGTPWPPRGLQKDSSGNAPGRTAAVFPPSIQ